MEKSIENIWKKGFEAEEKLSAPRISDLYKKKSGLVIQQINSASIKDNLSLIPVGLIIFAVFVFLGEVITGIYVALLIIGLFFLNRKMLKELETLDIKNSTYNYLVDYKSKMNNITKYTTWLMGAGFPLVTIPAYWMIFRNTEIMSNFLQLDFGVQILVILGLVGLLSVLGVVGYRLSARVIYGKLLAKLEIIIDDMEELMKT